MTNDTTSAMEEPQDNCKAFFPHDVSKPIGWANGTIMINANPATQSSYIKVAPTYSIQNVPHYSVMPLQPADTTYIWLTSDDIRAIVAEEIRKDRMSFVDALLADIRAIVAETLYEQEQPEEQIPAPMPPLAEREVTMHVQYLGQGEPLPFQDDEE